MVTRQQLLDFYRECFYRYYIIVRNNLYIRYVTCFICCIMTLCAVRLLRIMINIYISRPALQDQIRLQSWHSGSTRKDRNGIDITRKAMYKIVNETRGRQYDTTAPVRPDTDFWFIVRILPGETRDYWVVEVKHQDLIFMIELILELTPAIYSTVRTNKTLTVPQHILFCFLPNIQSFMEEQSNSDALLLRELVVYLNIAYKDTKYRIDRLVWENNIEFDLLWAIYRPGDIMFSNCPVTNISRCFELTYAQVRTLQDDKEIFHIEGQYLDHDGESLGYTNLEFQIPYFSGPKAIIALAAYPLSLNPKKYHIRSRLKHRGLHFLSLIGTHCRQYQGIAFQKTTTSNTSSSQHKVSGKIMLDNAYFYKTNPDYPRPHIKDKDTFANFCYDTMTRAQIRNCYAKHLNEDELIVCSPTIPGFSFVSNSWYDFVIDRILDFSWKPQPFDSLLLPEQQKELLLNAMSPYKVNRSRDYHPIEGNGQGMNMLLYGDTGVGKTYTAETLSQYLQRPLYKISIDECLAPDSKLQEYFDRAEHWNALLFLQDAELDKANPTPEPSTSTFPQSFLDTWNNYKGIFIMTSTNVSNYDPALTSRFHFSLRYQPLNRASRLELWKRWTLQARADITQEELSSLADLDHNGREIQDSMYNALRRLEAEHRWVYVDPRLAPSAPSTLFSQILDIYRLSKAFQRDKSRGYGQAIK